MQLLPLGDRVVLKQLEAEETTKSGILQTEKNYGETMSSAAQELYLILMRKIRYISVVMNYRIYL